MARLLPKPQLYWLRRRRQKWNALQDAVPTEPATITSANSANQPENAALSFSLTADQTVTWEITGGADALLFTLAGATLSMIARDYEAPADANGDNVYVVQVTATNAAEMTTDQTISITVTEVTEVPAQFGPSDWSVADDHAQTTATITISALPSDNGLSITDLEYQINGGAWVSLASTSTGDYQLTGLTYNVAISVALRAVNSDGNGPASASKSVTPTALPETNAYITRFAVPPTTARMQAIDALMADLIDAGVAAKLDAIHLHAAADSQVGRLNLLADASLDLTATGSVTFSADRGYAGDGGTGRLAAGANMNTLAKYKQDDATVFVWPLTNSQDADGDVMAIGALQPVVITRDTSDRLRARGNSGTTSSQGGVTDSRGLAGWVRNNSANYDLYKGSAAVVTAPVASTGVAASPFSVCGNGTAGTTRELAASGYGSALTPTEWADMHTALTTYLTAVGAI